MSALTIDFAQCRYRFTGLNESQAGLVGSRFGLLVSLDEKGGDVSIDVLQSHERERFMSRPPGPTEYRVTIAHGPDRIALAGIGFSATIDRTSLRAEMQTCLNDEWFLGAFENLLRVLACYRLFGEGGLVLHSAAFTDGARGFLFCGRSGAGKTTICSLADSLRLDILSDELNAITPQGKAFALRAMPFAGDFGGLPGPQTPYPLTGLLGLEHSDTALLHACSKGEAVSRIVASCPYVNADPLLVEPLTSRVIGLVERVPLRILSFARDTSFWSVLDHEYRNPHASLSR